MKKRVVALMLTFVLAFLLVGCGTKDEDVNADADVSLTGTMEDFQEIKSGEYSMEMKFKVTPTEEESLAEEDAMTKSIIEAIMSGVSIKMEGTIENETKASFSILYKTDSDSDYTKVTDFIVDDKDIYLNIASIREMISTIDELALYAAVIPADNEYVKISEEEMKQYSSLAGVTVPAIEETSNKEVINVAVLAISDFFEKTIKDVKPEVITVDGNSVKINVNNENTVAVIDAFLEADIEAAVDGFIDDVKDVDGGEEVAKEVEEKKADTIADVKSALTDAKNELTEADETFSLTGEAKVEGSNGSRVVTQDYAFELKAEEAAAEFTMNFKTTENKDAKVTIPESVISITELTSQLMNTMQ